MADDNPSTKPQSMGQTRAPEKKESHPPFVYPAETFPLYCGFRNLYPHARHENRPVRALSFRLQ